MFAHGRPGLLTLALVLLSSGRVEAQDVQALAPPLSGGEALPVVEHTLPNGLRFLILPRTTSPTVSFVVHVAVGSVHESLGSTGSAHLLEHLLFKGSSSIGSSNPVAEAELFHTMDATFDTLLALRSTGWDQDPVEEARLASRIRMLEDSARVFARPNEFDEILSRNGARGLNASTSYESTLYQVELPANRAELWFILEADRMRDPVFREFYREREVVEEERRGRLESDPGGRFWEEHMAQAFRVHPYGVAPIGHMDDLRSLSRPRLQAFHRAHYFPANTVVAVVGDIDPDSVRSWGERHFGSLAPGDPRPTPVAREPEQRGERRFTLRAEAEPQLRMGWKVGGEADPHLPALAMLSNLLVGGRDARLHRRLVRDTQLATFVSAGLTPSGRDPGLFVIHALPRGEEALEEVEALIEAELLGILQNPPTEAELDRIRSRLEASRVRRLTSNLGLAQQLAESAALWGDWRVTFGLQARLQAVTAQDIVEATRRTFVRDRSTVGILRRPEEPS
jgi:predicted Zn-dependent peptidase